MIKFNIIVLNNVMMKLKESVVDNNMIKLG